MRLRMLDRILFLEPGVRISAEKRLRAEEEYLRDHFPLFPVMPGVLMLEALFQSGMWLVRASEDFQHAVVLLQQARNVKFAGFVGPGQVLRVEAELTKLEEDTATVKAQGFVEENQVVSGRLILELSNLGERGPLHVPQDDYARQQLRKEFERLSAVTQPVT